MKILFITAHPYLPQMVGGLQRDVEVMTSRLARRGHEVSLLCGLMPNGYTGVRGRLKLKLSTQKAVLDRSQGHPVWRSWHPWEAVEFVAQKTRPDIIVVLARLPVQMALAAFRTGIPVVMYLQDVRFDHHGDDFAKLGPVPCIANSQFTADRYRAEYGVDPRVIFPLFEAPRYTTKTKRENVTFINPDPIKGLDITLSIARHCSEIPFSIIETWPLETAEKQHLLTQLEALPNVTLSGAVNDMRDIYAKAKILLVPSRVEEAYGRVASEAQFSGIPVVASSRGGLPEAVGRGGLVLDPDGPIEAWVSAVRRLWQEPDYYEGLSQEAFAHACRPSLDCGVQIEMWEHALGAGISHSDTAGLALAQL